MQYYCTAIGTAGILIASQKFKRQVDDDGDEDDEDGKDGDDHDDDDHHGYDNPNDDQILKGFTLP